MASLRCRTASTPSTWPSRVFASRVGAAAVSRRCRSTQEFRERRKQLAARGWRFVCHCERCVEEARAFLGRGESSSDDDEDGVVVEALF